MPRKLICNLVAVALVAIACPTNAAETRPTKYVIAPSSRFPIEFVWNVDASRCRLFDVGQLSEVIPAKNGKLDYERVDGALPPPRCPGVTFKTDVAYYTWTGSSAEQLDSFTLGYVPSRGGTSVEFPIVVYAPLAAASPICSALIDGHISLSLVDEAVTLLVERMAPRARILASFTPGAGLTLSKAAETCGYDSFAWTQQVIEIKSRQWGPPPFWDGASNSESPFRQHPFYYGVGPEWNRYPDYAFTIANYSRTSRDACPTGREWHYSAKGDNTLCYTDFPTASSEKEDEQFITALVGVTKNPNGTYTASEPLAKWVWRDDMASGILFSSDGKLGYTGCIQILAVSPSIIEQKRPDKC